MKTSPEESQSAVLGRLSMVAVAISLMLIGAGCASAPGGGQPEAVSLAEAKKITAQFEGGTFTPPPRNINDIKAVLSQEKPDDLEAYNQALAVADSEPPSTTDDRALAGFYLERALAAHDVGRAKQEIADYQMAVMHGNISGHECYTYALMGLCVAEVRGGNWSRGVLLGEQALTEITAASRLVHWNSNLAWMYAKIGDLDSAREALEQAKIHKRETLTWRNFPKKWRDLMNSANASGWAAYLDATGKFAQAEAQHWKAVRLWEPYKDGPSWKCSSPKVMPRLYNWKVSELAENLCRQGRLVEAEVHARQALLGALKSHGLYSAHTAMLVSRLNRVIFEQGRFKEAEILARANLDIYARSRTAEDSALFADARSVLADALLAQKRWQAALSEYDEIGMSLKTDRAAYEGFVTAKVDYWLALIKGGRSSEALKLVRPALKRITELLGEEDYLTAETRGVFAMALAAAGDTESALREFSKAVPILLDRSGLKENAAAARTAREFRLELILESYIHLLANIRGTELEAQTGVNAAAEAFRLADVARGRTVKRALAASSARATTKDPDLADLARREQDALTQIGALNGLLSNIMSAPPDQQNPAVIKDLQKRIERLRSARAALNKEIEARFPDYANLVEPKPVSIKEARLNLRPGEALFAAFVGESGSYVWAVPHQGPVEFASTGLDERSIKKMVEALRISLDPRSGTTLGELPGFDLETGYRLYAALLKSVEAGWKDADNLIVVAHGALGFLPFSVLPTMAVKLDPEKAPLFSNYRSVPWLARTHAVTVLPSVASLRTLRNLPAGDPSRKAFTGFGNPYFSLDQAARKAAATQVARTGTTRGMPLKRRGLKIKTEVKNEPARVDISSLPPLPDTADELRAIASALQADVAQDVFLGKKASEDRVKSMKLSGVKVLAFATHGLLPGELNGLSQPALALSSPQVTGGKEDGLLTMGEILGLKLNADWVVLSACNTATGEGAGAEAVSGLGRAFFYAGTRALLVSNWAVETTSAKTLTTELFRRQSAAPDLSRAEAFNRTMLDMIDKLGWVNSEEKMVFSYAHPIFWAPFSLVGDGALY